MHHESQLIFRFINGNESAFVELYDNYSGALYNVILRMTKNEELAQDLLQETFITIWNKAGQYDPKKGRFYTWAFRIARHKVLNYLRTQKKLIQKDDLGVYVDETIDDDLNVKIKELKGAVLKLNKQHQQAIELVYFSGLTHQEAHQIMKVPLGTFKSYVQQAMRELRKHYKALLLLLVIFLMHKG